MNILMKYRQSMETSKYTSQTKISARPKNFANHLFFIHSADFGIC